MTLVNWYGRRAVFGTLILALILLGMGIAMNRKSTRTSSENAQVLRTVSLKTAAELAGNSDSVSVVGTVSALREARLTSEAAGRVTAVYAKLGDKVKAGAILAMVENSRERAVLLQAQGAYEAAQAGATSGTSNLETAKRGAEEARTVAQNTSRAAFTTADSVISNTVYKLFSSPDTLSPGLLIDGKGQAPLLNAEFVAIRNLLANWPATTISDPMKALDVSERDTKRINAFISTLAALYADDTTPTVELVGFGSVISGARSALDGTLAQISGARSALNASENALTQATIAATSNGPSLSGAQTKQALGALRLAQASLEKSIVRSPISGTVQALSVKEGTTVGLGQPTAVISSEGSLEISAFISPEDAVGIETGSTVNLENSAKGTVTQIASALDPVTKKIEMRIAIDGDTSLVNGQTVNVFLPSKSAGEASQTIELLLPISTIKMTPDGAIVFTVSEDKKLISRPVTLGAIVGDRVTVFDGIAPGDTVVVDARGLRADEVVNVK